METKEFEGVYNNLEEVSNSERECRELYGVQPKVRNWRQYNLGRVEEGWFYYKEAIEKEKLGLYKITQKWNKTKDETINADENKCIYWEEYWYTTFDGNKQMELIKYLCRILDTYISISPSEPVDDEDEEITYDIGTDYQDKEGVPIMGCGTVEDALYMFLIDLYPRLTPNQILKIREILE